MENREEARRRSLARAISVVTAWTEGDEGVSPDELMWPLIIETVREGETARAELTMGFFELANYLLVMLEQATKRPMRDLLHDVAVMNEPT